MLFSCKPEGFQFGGKGLENGASVTSVVSLRASVCSKAGLLTLGKIYEYNFAKFRVFFPIFEYNV
jgi:hypothetical protein